MAEDGSGGNPGHPGNDDDHGDAGEHAREAAGKRGRRDLRNGGGVDLRCRRPALHEAPPLRCQSAPEPDRRDHREAQQEHADLPADQAQPPAGDIRAVPRGDKRAVGAAERVLRARARQGRLSEGLAGEDSVDLPGVEPAGRDRSDPAVDAVEAVERRNPLEGIGSRREQRGRESALARASSHDAEQRGIGHVRDADADEVDAVLPP